MTFDAYSFPLLTGNYLKKQFFQTSTLRNWEKKKLYDNETKILCFSSLDGENTDESTDGPPPDFLEERVDELLALDKEDKAEEDGMDVDEPTSDVDISSTTHNESFHSTRSQYGGPPSQRTISSAYKAVRAAKLAGLPSRCLSSGRTLPLPPVGASLDVKDGRNFIAFQVNSFATKRNITSSFDTGSLVCKTCDLKPDHKILVSNKALDPNCQQDPVVFVLSDQSFPACFPAGGEGNCLKIIWLEDGSLSDLTAVFLETVANYVIPAGSVVLIHSLSYLTWVGPAAYAEDFVRACQRICGLYRTGLSVLHGLPVLQDGTDNPSITNNLSIVL